jgi:hypothetical protein
MLIFVSCTEGGGGGSAVSTRLRLGKQQMRRTQIREQNQNAKPQADPASHGLKLYAKPAVSQRFAS